MELDKTRIEIRERGVADLFDLALHVIRSRGLPLAMWLVVGIAPFALLNGWLLAGALEAADYRSDDFDDELAPFYWSVPAEYVFLYMFAVVLEIPLATAPATLYLGQSLFVERPSTLGILRSLVGSLPQMFVFQVVLRGFFTMMFITWIVLFVVWPHLNEIILLERNPMFPGKGRASTLSRASNLHARSTGELFARWLVALLVGSLLAASLFCGLRTLRGLMTFDWSTSTELWGVLLPISIWAVVAFFTVVRFLGYLDLRIRTEGWEVELLLRAEAAKLERQVA